MVLKRIWEIGVTDGMNPEDRKRVMFSNGVFIILGSLILIQEVITGVQSFVPLTLILLSAFCVLLNHFGHHLTARILFALVATFLISVFPILFRAFSPTSYFMHPVYLLCYSPVFHLLFSREKEKAALYTSLAISFLLTVFSTDFLLAFDPAQEPKVPLVRSVTLMKVTFGMLWVFVNTVIAYALKTNSDFYLLLEEQRDLVGKQRTLLQSRNEELSKANNELLNLNKRVFELNEVLEHRVTERTQELTSRNKILSDYAHMNAHLLRTPVTRIMGLIDLLRITEDPEEKKKVHEILLASAEDLDKVVRSINDRLAETR
ncbi:MAG TPA: histidine kinase dimerization/phospho-acceptor domain-containing protein [Cyclobacteriaceae bacterium]|nr:histidine kinase dimerization/phospho-acceptor domain-containing protein [Cyclobacteriaceae bacterium]